MQTGNASSVAVVLLTELQERALLHAVYWITQSPNASSIPSLIDNNHEKHQDQNGSRANSRTSTSLTTYQLRTTRQQDHYRNQRLQETAGEKCTAKWKITMSMKWVPAPFLLTIGIWARKKSSTVLGDYIPFLLSVY